MSTPTLPPPARKFGRRRPIARAPRLALARYLTAELPPLPPSVDYATPARRALSQMYLNDQLGCCVVAAMAHLIGVFTANASGAAAIFQPADLIALYENIGGYNPLDPTSDRGCDEQTALNFWQHHGAPPGSHAVAGWLAVDPTNVEQVKAALYLFENLFFGIELPDAWVQAASADGFVWDVGTPNPNNGHAVAGVGYDRHGIQIATWGMVGTLTWDALRRDVIAASGGELYTVLSADTIRKATAKAPSGLDWAQLVRDFDAIGGRVPEPPPPLPAPAPPPLPRPATAPSRAQVLAAVAEALNKLPWDR